MRALPELRDRQPGEYVQAALLLLGGGYAHPAWPSGAPAAGGHDAPFAVRPAARDGARRLNLAIIDRLRAGIDLHRLAAPLLGSSMPTDVMEGLVIGQLLDNASHDPEALIDGVTRDVLRSGRSLLRAGQPLRDQADARALVGETVRNVLARRLPLLRAAGVVD